MAVYMVERSLKGITMDQLGAAQKSAIETGKKMTASGKKVRYIRSTFVPDEARCMCLFGATGSELVKELNEEAKIPFTRIVEALDLTPSRSLTHSELPMGAAINSCPKTLQSEICIFLDCSIVAPQQ